MQRSPAEPKAAPDKSFTTWSRIGVGHDDTVVLRAAKCLDALRILRAAMVDVMRDVGRADKADRRDVRMVEDRVDHLLVAVDHLQQAFGCARFEEQFG